MKFKAGDILIFIPNPSTKYTVIEVDSRNSTYKAVWSHGTTKGEPRWYDQDIFEPNLRLMTKLDKALL